MRHSCLLHVFLQANPSLGNCRDVVVPPDGVLVAAGDASSAVPPYLVELVQTTVRDEVEEVAERLHDDIVRMHVDMLVRVNSVQVRTGTFPPYDDPLFLLHLNFNSFLR